MRSLKRFSIVVRLAALAALCLVISGCGSKVSKENFDKVKTGMTEKEVTDIMGAPTESTNLGAGKDTNAKSLVWRNGNDVYSVSIINDKVIAKMGGGAGGFNIEMKDMKVPGK
jgi:hypothetical protein